MEAVGTQFVPVNRSSAASADQGVPLANFEPQGCNPGLRYGESATRHPRIEEPDPPLERGKVYPRQKKLIFGQPHRCSRRYIFSILRI